MIPVSVPFIAPNQKSYVNDCLDRNWISAFGKYDQKLVESFSDFIGSKFASTCSNGTVALHLALLACSVKANDEVIIPNFNGPYSLFAVTYVNAKPVIVDVNKNWDIELSNLENAVSDKTKALIITHLYGVPSNISLLKDFCKKRGIFIIEDCAEAHGAKIGTEVVGSIGDIGCFSFYANKIIASGEGGIITTSNKELFEKVEYFKNQTFNKGPIKTFVHKYPGYNYRMSDIHCAIAYSHLEVIEEIIFKREDILQKYKLYLPDFHDSFQMTKKNVKSVNWVTTFQLTEELIHLRDELVVFLFDNNIQSRNFFAPMCEQPFLKDFNGLHSGDLSISSNIAKSGLYLPTYIGIEDKEIKYICEKIKFFIEKKINYI
jgi:perosamine synthetase